MNLITVYGDFFTSMHDACVSLSPVVRFVGVLGAWRDLIDTWMAFILGS